MKKHITENLFILLLCMTIGMCLTGCGASGGASETKKAGSSAESENNTVIDLTTQTSTMAYSRLFALMAEPDTYEGCTLKMEGKFLPVKEKGKQYYFCVITDEAGCCAQAIEFLPAKALKYPDDFPKEEEDFKLKGVVEVYSEGGEKSCRLKKAKISDFS